MTIPTEIGIQNLGFNRKNTVYALADATFIPLWALNRIIVIQPKYSSLV